MTARTPKSMLLVRRADVFRIAFGALSVCVLLQLTTPFALADQTDPRLDELFAALSNAPSGPLAVQVEQQIWAIWFEAQDPAASELLRSARSTAERGDMDQAMNTFDTLVEQHPRFAEAWNQRAIFRYLTGDVEGSLRDIEQVLMLEPRHFGALSGQGQCFLQLQRYQEALIAFEDALSINPWITSVRAQINMLRGLIGGKPQPI